MLIITNAIWSLSIEHSLCIIIHTSSSHRPNGEVQNKPSVTGISGHSAQIIVRCVVWSVSDDSIGNGWYRGTLNGCMGILNSLYKCCEQAAIMPRCASASEVYGSVFVCLCVSVCVCVCIDCYRCSRINEVQVTLL